MQRPFAGAPTSSRPAHPLRLQLPRLTLPHQLLTTFEAGSNAVTKNVGMFVAVIAAAELPAGEFGTVLNNLVMGITNAASSADVKCAAIDCVGSIFQVVPVGEFESMDNEVRQVIGALVQVGLTADAPAALQLVTATALQEVLYTAEPCMAVPAEATAILQALGRGTQSASSDVRVACYRDLHMVVKLFYQHIAGFMEDFRALSEATVQHDSEELVKCMAVEFWVTVADMENDIVKGYEEGPSANHVERMLAWLLELVKHTLVILDEDKEYDEENIATFGAALLMSMAQLHGPKVLAGIQGFIETGFGATEDWRQRAAATRALGAILRAETSLTQLEVVVQRALPTLIGRIIRKEDGSFNEPSVLVREATVFALQCVAQHGWPVFKAAATASLAEWQAVLQHLLVVLQHDDLRVAYEAAFFFARSFERIDDECEFMFENTYGVLLQHMLLAADRDDADDEFREVVFEALSFAVENAPESEMAVLNDLLHHSIAQLVASVQKIGAATQPNQRMALELLVNRLLALLHALVQGVDPSVLATNHNGSVPANVLVEQCLPLARSLSSAAQQDAVYVLNALADALGEQFQYFLAPVHDMILVLLQRADDASGLRVTCQLVSAICKSVPSSLLAQFLAAYLDGTAALLQRPDVSRQARPEILAAMGDVVSALGAAAQPKIAAVVELLHAQYKQALGESPDEDYVDWLNRLRSSCVDTLSNILFAIRDHFPGSAPALLPSMLAAFVQWIFNIYAEYKAAPEAQDEDLLISLAGAIGDMAAAVGAEAAAKANLRLSVAPVQEMLYWAQQAQHEQWGQETPGEGDHDFVAYATSKLLQ